MKKSRKSDAESLGQGFDQLRDVLDEVSRENPLPASGNELILLEIDPHRAHVCWNVDPDQAQVGSPLVLRVFDITDSGNIDVASQAFDVEVYGLQGRWYLDLWRDDRTFVTQLGYRQPDGSLRVLAQSNEVSTPPAEPQMQSSAGGHVDPNGLPLHTDWPGDAKPSPEPTPSVTEPELNTEAAAPAEAVLVVEPVTLLEPEFPMAYWPISSDTPPRSELDSHNVETAVAEAPDAGSSPAEPSVTTVAAGDASVAFEEDVMEGTPTDFPPAELLVAAVQENRGAIDAFYEAMEARTEAAASYAPETTGSAPGNSNAPVKEPAHPEPDHGQPAPLEQVLGLSSLELPGRDVLLEVNAELHIFGRSKPNTELTLYGQVVKTRPDGSFSVRRPLPHGAVVLPLLYTKKGEGKTEV